MIGIGIGRRLGTRLKNIEITTVKFLPYFVTLSVT